MLRELGLRAEVRGKCASTPSLITDTFLPQDHPKCRLLEPLTEPALKTPRGDCRSKERLWAVKGLQKFGLSAGSTAQQLCDVG